MCWPGETQKVLSGGQGPPYLERQKPVLSFSWNNLEWQLDTLELKLTMSFFEVCLETMLLVVFKEALQKRF